MDEENNLLIENLKKYFKEENLDNKELLIELKKYFEEENLDVKENLTECKKQENIYSNNKKISKKNSVIDKFKILKQKQAVFKFNDIKDVENSLSLIKDVENISSYLKKSTDENAKIYLKLIERYERNIDKKLKIEDCFAEDDEDEFYEWGEEFIDRFASILSNDFLKKFMISIMRVLKNDKNSKFMNGLLREINKYLNKLTIYSKAIYPNDYILDEDMNKLEIIPEKTDKQELNKKIYVVDMLPYFLEIFDENHEEYVRTIKGLVYCYSSKL